MTHEHLLESIDRLQAHAQAEYERFMSAEYEFAASGQKDVAQRCAARAEVYREFSRELEALLHIKPA